MASSIDHTSMMESSLIPVGVGDEHDALVLLLYGGVGLPLLGSLSLTLEMDPLLLSTRYQLNFGDLGHDKANDVRCLAVRAQRDDDNLLLLELDGAGGRLGPLLGVLLAAASKAGLGGLDCLPAGLFLGARISVARLGGVSRREIEKDSERRCEVVGGGSLLVRCRDDSAEVEKLGVVVGRGGGDWRNGGDLRWNGGDSPHRRHRLIVTMVASPAVAAKGKPVWWQ
ncbi:hypothetical protein GUJ93_ZPchr0008g13991 [Zizania palustris]|uniref:Uncharacterized protein n=1 Tax=Zizania palustris TaxID=103762 RepID=A0A8J5RY54_ZIZPA|nr:hypothetical protein GUJ93_ZPchr0008g13991 [Zizania palustris]